MKKVVLVLVAVVFVGGCWRSAYVHEEYYCSGKLKSRITLENAKAMVNAKSGAVDINLPDGATLRAVGIETIADPNSAIAIGKAIAIPLTGGGSQVLENWSK